MLERMHSLVERLRRRLSGEEGFTIMELTIVLMIMSVLMTIALPSYLSVRDRADRSAARQDVSQALKAVLAYGNDNFAGSRADPNAIPDDVGFENVDNLASLAANYDASLSIIPGAPYIVDPLGWDPTALGATTATDFCLTALSGRWTAAQNGPTGTLTVGTNFDANSCSAS